LPTTSGRRTEKSASSGSRDGLAKLHIFAADNAVGTTLASIAAPASRSTMPEQCSTSSRSVSLNSCSPARKAEKAFYERVTFACNNRTIHGWQIVFPASQRTLYDLVADAINRSYTHKIGSRCSDRVSENNARQRLH
jgi:hypothetical protein